MHGVVLRQVHKIRYLQINYLRVAFSPFYLSINTLKQTLKVLDLDYPRQKDGTPLSYTKLNELDFLSHIAFIEILLAQNGYTLDLKETNDIY